MRQRAEALGDVSDFRSAVREILLAREEHTLPPALRALPLFRPLLRDPRVRVVVRRSLASQLPATASAAVDAALRAPELASAPGAGPALERVLRNQDVEMRLSLLKVISGNAAVQEDARVVQFLASSLRHSDPKVRRRAVDLLAGNRDLLLIPAISQSLRPLSEDADAEVRLRVRALFSGARGSD